MNQQTQLPDSPTKCPVSGKRQFPSEEAAEKFQQKNQEKYGNARQFPYACEDCSSWHLSSTPPGAHNLGAHSSYPTVSARVMYRGTSEQTVEHRAQILKLFDSGMTREEIAKKLNTSYQVVCLAIRTFSDRYTAPKKSAKPGDLIPLGGTPVTHQLDAVLTRKIRLKEQLEKIQREMEETAHQEQVLRDELILKISYENGLITLKKEQRTFQLSLADAETLYERLEKIILAEPAPAQPAAGEQLLAAA